ncbi:hypothetical protein VPH35_000899 [Triticum aestivum]
MLSRTEPTHLSLPNYRAGRRRLDLPLPAISGDTADTHEVPSTPSTISPIYLIRRRQNRRHHSILAPLDPGPVGLPPAAAATTSPCLHPPPAQPHARGVQPRASGACGFTGAARSPWLCC